MTPKGQLFHWAFIISIVNLCTISCIGSEISDADGKNDFDILTFSQMWPATECVVWKTRHEENSCAMPDKKSTWTIHGIWPSKRSTSSPAYCKFPTPIPKFDLSSLEPDTFDQLKQYWPTIHTENTDESFWEYEWNKHGKCATPLEQLNSPTKYFEQGLTWHRQYTMTYVLSKADIKPGSAYDVTEINNAIRNALNVNPKIMCAKMKDLEGNIGMQYLHEVKLCFDKQLELVDCGKILSKNIGGVLTNCDMRRKVYYPDIPIESDHGSTLWRFTYHFITLIVLILIVLFAYKTAKNLSSRS